MAFICLPQDKIDEFKQALKDKTLNMGELLNMTTEERTKLFEKYAGENAKAVNTLFEEKLVLKNKVQGLKNWASKVGGIGKYSEEGKVAMDKSMSDYRAMQQQRTFNPKEDQSFLNDLADKKLGVHISRDTAAKVFELSANMQKLKGENPKMSGVSDEYLQARNELNSYIAAQHPLSTGDSIMKNLSIIGRNNLILNPATPLKTTLSQIVNSTMDAITRRIGTFSAKGAASDLVGDANKEAWQTFTKTGDNTAAMRNFDDTNILGSRPGIGKNEQFKVPTGESAKGGIMGKIESLVRGTAKVSNKVAIDWEHSVSFTKFYQKTFFDANNLMATDIAKGEGLAGADLRSRAGEIFKDAARIEPQTKEGAIVRMASQEQAARITSTNDTLVSELSVSLKQGLNNIGNRIYKGFNLGDFIIPIAKIPANIIANGLDNAGAGLPMGIRDVFEGRSKIQSADLQTRYEGMVQYANGIQRLSRITGTVALSALVASQFSKQNFKPDKYGNHFFQLGNVWINTEYLSAIAPALAGFMYMKQYGTGNPIHDAEEYVSGAGSALLNTPGINEASSLVSSIANTNITKGIQKYASDFFTSRGEPAFLSNLMKSRPIERLFFGASGAETDAQATQDASITSWESTPGAQLTQFKAKIGDAKYRQANADYNTKYSAWLGSVQKVKSYQALSAADQTKVNTSKQDAIKKQIFQKYGFVYQAPPSKPLPKF